jgi:hypothetical protein
VHTGYWLVNLRETDQWEDLGVDRTIILIWIIRKWNRGIDWIDLAQDRERWRDVVNAIKCGEFLD